jgi:hypothetical protein
MIMIFPLTPDEALVVDVTGSARGFDSSSMIEQANSILRKAAGVG